MEAELPLEAATKEIIVRYHKGADMLTSCAVALQRLKARVEAGEAGDTDWKSYRHQHLDPHLTNRWLNKLLQLAPPNATEEEVARHVEANRAKVRDAVREHRRRAGLDSGNYVIPEAEDADSLALSGDLERCPHCGWVLRARTT